MTREDEAALYQSKPTTITAVCWTGKNTAEVQRLVGRDANGTKLFMDTSGGVLGRLWVMKSGAWCYVEAGTYIVQEPTRRGFYPCTADVFTERWDPLPLAVGGEGE